MDILEDKLTMDILEQYFQYAEQKKKKKKSPERSFILTKNHSRSATGTGHSAVVHHLVTEPREYRQIISPYDPFPFHPTLRKQPAEGLGLQENLERVD